MTSTGPGPRVDVEAVQIPAGDALLSGDLAVPAAPRGLVVFAHGSGSSRTSPRNRHVASILHGGGLATLLFDLLTPNEETLDETTGELRFDIALLTRRLIGAVDWTPGARVTTLPLGLFGASTGAAAALGAAAARSDRVVAVVSRGGRPDLAGDALPNVDAPTLLIVGGRDDQVIQLNRAASSHMHCTREIVLVEGATHLFEEPGALDQVASLARRWFERFLSAPATQTGH
ncbi:MAG: dienelactone hydrolase family protein [Gemmatimonadaceae bacterium]